jgi:hypothetical protein
MIHFEETTLIGAPIDRVFDLSRSVEVHLLANVHCNQQALATAGVTTGLVDPRPAGHLARQTLRTLAQSDQ